MVISLCWVWGKNIWCGEESGSTTTTTTIVSGHTTQRKMDDVASSPASSVLPQYSNLVTDRLIILVFSFTAFNTVP
ncbi:hypothetical protein E2C01_013754 [Portunus trituberculatus]|uniref:Uncharacterized protein n=1 Tax=Portunus trituberculatus TaxID=210409 RepID=A0A5B7DI52_PORTR|nr:hypothetical protein [Portunus trituberculatus]